VFANADFAHGFIGMLLHLFGRDLIDELQRGFGLRRFRG
jgi:hypothetical protein